MFSLQHQTCTGFSSAWSKSSQVADSSSQTDGIKTHDSATQAIRTKSTRVQTDKDNYDNIKFVEDNSSQLASFLQRAEPLVLDILKRNAKSRAFDNYNPLFTNSTDSLTVTHSLYNSTVEEGMHVTCLTWSCVGSVIAASYGKYDHADWCTHKAFVCTWSLDRSSLKSDKPDVTIDQSSCVMCLAYHPKQAALLAGANYNGEIIIWDLSDTDEMLVASSTIGDDSHQEPVNKVLWIPDTDSRRYQLMSVGGDGKILVWSVHLNKKSLKLTRGFYVMAESLPVSLKSRSGRADKEIGITSLSFNPDDPDTFITGTESGAIFKCSQRASGTPAPSSIQCSVTLTSPVTFTYSPHNAPVYSVDCSPFQRNVFISCSVDHTLHVYNTLQAQPVVIIEPGLSCLYSVQWSPTRPSVVAVTTETGHLLVYDLTKGNTPTESLQVSQMSLHALEFNSKRPSLIAAGDSTGHVHVIQLTNDLVNSVLNADVHSLETLTSVKQTDN